MDCELYIKFYKSASGKQNMWLEKNHEVGTRYEIDSVEKSWVIMKETIEKSDD